MCAAVGEQVRPGPGGPRVVKVMVHLTERQRDALRKYAADRGLSVSGAVRRLVDDLLLDEED